MPVFYDYTYLIYVLPAVLFSLWASRKVKSTYKKYQNQRNARHMTGAQAARAVLDKNGLYQVGIRRVSGELTDHFDPRSNCLYLSDPVYANDSCVAVGVACHEAGHAVQHAEHYAPLRLRSAIIPVTNIGSRLAIPLIMIGLILSAMSEMGLLIAYAGVACFGLSTLFQLVTLPVEFNASSRAQKALSESYILTEDELRISGKVLRAAAMTYVAALAVSLAQLLRFLVLISGNSRRRR